MKTEKKKTRADLQRELDQLRRAVADVLSNVRNANARVEEDRPVVERYPYAFGMATANIAHLARCAGLSDEGLS